MLSSKVCAQCPKKAGVRAKQKAKQNKRKRKQVEDLKQDLQVA
jgi:hypothetical protein